MLSTASLHFMSTPRCTPSTWSHVVCLKTFSASRHQLCCCRVHQTLHTRVTHIINITRDVLALTKLYWRCQLYSHHVVTSITTHRCHEHISSSSHKLFVVTTLTRRVVDVDQHRSRHIEPSRTFCCWCQHITTLQLWVVTQLLSTSITWCFTSRHHNLMLTSMILKLVRVMSRVFRLHQNFVTRDIVTQASCNLLHRHKTLHAYRSLIVSISLSH